ncbi:MAG: alpha/beta fold hydrolase [Novosphingobium sp.]|nr:alpha/beta fold hydrolase [Novosphingobium sp.]
MKVRIALDLVGPMALRREGEGVSLPSSRKTRALLAYLAATDRPARREHLCGLLWDLPDDPRGALRWSLSKIRPLVDDADRVRLIAEGETVSLDCSDICVDWRRLREVAGGDVRKVGSEILEAAVAPEGELLEGAEMRACDTFQGWLVAMREDTRRWQLTILRELVGRFAEQQERREQALALARRWSALDPYDAIARTTMIDLLRSSGRVQEAEQQRGAAIRALDAAELRVPGQLRTRIGPSGASAPANARLEGEPPLYQQVRFCMANDGTGLAYSSVGSGPPLVKTANWLNHLEHDFDSPVWQHWIRNLTQYRTLFRYDERGNGLSDWNVHDIGFEAFVDDLSSVVDAAGLETFDLFGVSQGCSVAIAYAVRNPDRVRKLVLYGGYALGWELRDTPDEVAMRRAMVTLTGTGWGRNNPAFRQMFTSLFFPDMPPHAADWFNELQKVSASPENAVRLQEAFGKIDVQDMVPRVVTPTLVLHSDKDAVIPFSSGRSLAAAIPHSQFVQLDSLNHLVLEDEPAWLRAASAIRTFLETEIQSGR